MDKNNSIIHLIPADFHESKDGDRSTSEFDVLAESNFMQTQNDLSDVDAPYNHHEERSESSNGLFQGSTKVLLLERLQKYCKLTSNLGATILENDAIQLRDRLISYRKQHQLQNDASPSLPENKDRVTTHILMSDHRDKQPIREQKDPFESHDGYEKMEPVQESSTSIDSVKVQLKAHPESSSSHQSYVSPLSPVLEKCEFKEDDGEKSGASRTLRRDEKIPDKLRKRNQSTAFSSTRNGEDQNNDNDLEGNTLQSFTCDEGEYLCNRAKRMKKMASLLLQIESFHESFMMQVIDCMVNDDSST